MTLNEVELQYSLLLQKFYVDENDLLREKCTDLEHLGQIITAFEEILLFIEDEEIKYSINSRLGNLYRINKDIPKALHSLQESYIYYKKIGDVYTMTRTCMSYAEALKYDHRYTEALEKFEEAFTYCKKYELSDLEHYIWQHRGKCCMEMGNITEAESCFIKAYILRKEIQDERLLEASNKALNFISKVKR